MNFEYLLSALHPEVLLWMAIGSIVGLVFGALPGIGPETGIALFIPITFNMDATVALACLAAIYVSGVFGGNIPAILMNTPGEPDAIFTALDGFPMTKRGEGRKALVISTIGAFIGGVVGGISMLLLSPFIAGMVVLLGPLELFLLTMIGISVIVTMTQKSMLKSFISAFLGLAFSFVGTDKFTSRQRFTFGRIELVDGISLLSVIIGFFAISQMLIIVAEKQMSITETAALDAGAAADKKADRKKFWKSIEWKKIIPPALRASVIGTAIGIVPGSGGTTASGLCYSLERRLSKNPEKFGNGSEEALVSVSSACNGVVGGSLIPLITLSIPGCSTAALFISGLMVHGLSPGERLFTNNANIIYPFMFSMIIAQAFILIFGLLGGRWFSLITRVQNSILVPIILVLTVIGAYTARGQMFDVFLIVLIAIIGYWWERMEVPVSPFVLAFVLGPGAENKFRRAVLILESDFMGTLLKPIPLILLVINLLLVIMPVAGKLKEYLNRKKEPAQPAAS